MDSSRFFQINFATPGNEGWMRLRSHTLIDAPNAFEDWRGSFSSANGGDTVFDDEFTASPRSQTQTGEAKAVSTKPFIVFGVALCCLVVCTLCDLPGFDGNEEARRCLGLL